LAAILELTFTRYFFTLKMISMDSLTVKSYKHQIHHSLQDRYRWSYIACKGAAAILDAMLNYTFLSHIWNVYPSFLKSPMNPYKDQESKFGDILGPPGHRTRPQLPDYE